MQRAQFDSTVVMAVIGIAIFAVCLVVFNSVEYPLCNAVNATCASGNFTNATYTALAHSPIRYGSQLVYNTTACTGTAMTNGTNYTMNITAGGIRLIGDIPVTALKSITYYYYDANYLGGGNVCSVVNNLPVMFAVGGLVLAGLWWMAR